MSSVSIGPDTTEIYTLSLHDALPILNGAGTLTVSGQSTLSGGTQSGSGTTIGKSGEQSSSPHSPLDVVRSLQLDGNMKATETNVCIHLDSSRSPDSWIMKIGSRESFN